MTGSSDGDSEADLEFQKSLAAGGKRGRPRRDDTGRGEEGRGAKVAREDVRSEEFKPQVPGKMPCRKSAEEKMPNQGQQGSR
ncbi:hypothetical protein SKAU_G00135200 [Synaphobranchus kaupii]|uniref:Uncharacterized protein n=1 Tax=Synaphobranchus kaupii TaxID=118154 RepID=A0A9Q1FRE5_SYNKA|nr:hypothetical protein SKAU_G00135200 [Synaphobranchus kaupii]